MRMDVFRWLPGACGSLGPALIPPAHIAVLWYFWQNYSRFVDKRFCSCSCWDTVFKGTYESGIASYKHMYFNATQNTMKMWLLIVVGVIALYECTKHLVQLLLQCKITELISTSVVLHLANVENQVTARKTLSIVGIALLHILASGVDQFISNVFRGEGYPHQVVRDLGFMIPDVMHLLLPLWLLRQTRLESFSTRPFYRDRNLRRDVVLMFFVVTVLFTICSFL
uniref:Uncharacterized protein n=1 Tax=Anopheles minimus TaxID=112268 RepID=A0A182WJ30_9DIPT